MSRMIGILVAALGLFALSAPLASASYNPGGPPKIDSRSAANVIDTGAMLRADINPNAKDDWWKMSFFDTSYFFQIGPTTGYGVSTAAASLSWWQHETTVTVPVTGLTPGTTYNYRAVASNGAGTTYGPNKSFKTTGKAPTTPTASSDGKSGNNGKGEVGGKPELGHSVAAAAATGTVLVREQGSDEFHEIGDGETIPLNSTFDTTGGTVLLKAARSNGTTYTGAFHGGQFTVHQSTKGKGMTNLELEGGDFSACGPSRMGRATASSAHKTLRKLWGKDHGGRFKTSSRGSVATVRGTEWLTVDRCDGTLTRVTKGLVQVRERGTGRSKLLHMGESFLAHVPH